MFLRCNHSFRIGFDCAEQWKWHNFWFHSHKQNTKWQRWSSCTLKVKRLWRTFRGFFFFLTATQRKSQKLSSEVSLWLWWHDYIWVCVHLSSAPFEKMHWSVMLWYVSLHHCWYISKGVFTAHILLYMFSAFLQIFSQGEEV